EITRIITQKKATLNPFEYEKWERTVIKHYYVPNGKKTDKIPYYMGELAQPATRTTPDSFDIVSWDKQHNKNEVKITLKAVNFKDRQYEELMQVPEFKAVYDEMFAIHKEAYSLFLREHRYKYVHEMQTWAFDADFNDLLN